jgi:hypothetical protein
VGLVADRPSRFTVNRHALTQSWRENPGRVGLNFPPHERSVCSVLGARHNHPSKPILVLLLKTRLLDLLLKAIVSHSTLTNKMNAVSSSTGRSSTPLSTSKSKRRTESGLNFYTEPPTVELSIDDFEVFALKRLKVSFCSTHCLAWLSLARLVLTFISASRPRLNTRRCVRYPTGAQKD